MRDRLLSILSPVGLIALWEALVRVGWLDVRFVAPPSEVTARLVQMAGSGLLWGDLSITLQRLLLGFLLGAIPAVALGMMMGLSRPVYALLAPFAASLYPIPKIAILPMIIILLGLGETSKVVTVAISVFFLLLLNTAAGVLSIDPRYLDIARNNGATRWQIYRTVAWPAALPSILTGAQLGMGFALTVIVGTEFLGAERGIGYRIWTAYQVYDIATVYAGLVVTAILGWGLTLVLQEIERWVLPWRVSLTPSRTSTAEDAFERYAAIWFQAVRPNSFSASVVPVTLGSIAAAYRGTFDVGLYLLTLIGSVAIHAGANLANDYYDFRKGADTPDSLTQSKAILRGLLSPRAVLLGAVAALSLGALIGLYLVSLTGPFIFWLGVFSVLAAFFYTAGPVALGYVGLGEVTAGVFMGPVMVLGAYYVQTRAFAPEALWLSLPIGLLVAAHLQANNLRDIEGDRAIGKQTLAVRLGRPRADWEYFALLSLAYVSLALLILLGIAPLWTVAAFLTAPAALNLAQRVASTLDPNVLNVVLRRTALLHARFGLLMIVGMLLALVVR